jgi:CheY-like chemotaxis protein
MDEKRRYSILLVDDDPRICESMAILLNDGGYNVATATHGLDALNKLKFAAPDLIVSDLSMPYMSGFELLSVVHNRFPQIPVIAMSGIAGQENNLPDGVIADAFYGKGRSQPNELLAMATHLIETTIARPDHYFGQTDRVQEPRYRNEPNGRISTLLICPDCLRDLSIEFVDNAGLQKFGETQCPSCLTMIRFVSGPCLAGILDKVNTVIHAGSASAIRPDNPVIGETVQSSNVSESSALLIS